MTTEHCINKLQRSLCKLAKISCPVLYRHWETTVLNCLMIAASYIHKSWNGSALFIASNSHTWSGSDTLDTHIHVNIPMRSFNTRHSIFKQADKRNSKLVFSKHKLTCPWCVLSLLSSTLQFPSISSDFSGTCVHKFHNSYQHQRTCVLLKLGSRKHDILLGIQVGLSNLIRVSEIKRSADKKRIFFREARSL